MRSEAEEEEGEEDEEDEDEEDEDKVEGTSSSIFASSFFPSAFFFRFFSFFFSSGEVVAGVGDGVGGCGCGCSCGMGGREDTSVWITCVGLVGSESTDLAAFLSEFGLSGVMGVRIRIVCLGLRQDL